MIGPRDPVPICARSIDRQALVQIGQNEACDFFCDADGNVKPAFADLDLVERSVGSDGYREAAEVVGGTLFSFGGVEPVGNFIEQADFVKLREVSLRYDFTDLLRKANVNRYLRSLSLTISARNLWFSSDYSGPDPEVNHAGARGSTRSQDLGTLPQPRVIYFTVSVGL